MGSGFGFRPSASLLNPEPFAPYFFGFAVFMIK
jgi:hypothetical protein